jgi:hypothetical protein
VQQAAAIPAAPAMTAKPADKPAGCGVSGIQLNAYHVCIARNVDFIDRFDQEYPRMAAEIYRLAPKTCNKEDMAKIDDVGNMIGIRVSEYYRQLTASTAGERFANVAGFCNKHIKNTVGLT